MLVRLNKFLAQAGVASRREADRMILEGKITVNGQLVQELGVKIDDEKDRVKAGGKKIEKKEGVIYLMFHKPKGYLVTLKDPFHRPTIFQLLPRFRKRVYPVGRLDFDSEGLLLLTNDGELAHRLTHPRFQVRKTYLVEVRGRPEPSRLSVLEKGIVLEGRKTAPARIRIAKGGEKKTSIQVELHEGRKREVKRMLASVGHPVVRLRRVGFAGLKLEKLKSGEWRFLTRREVLLLRKQVGLDE